MDKRNIELKTMMSMPDNFEIIKVRAVTTASIIPAGSVFYIANKAAQDSGFGALEALTTNVAAVDLTLIAGDTGSIIGVVGDFCAIQIIVATTFADNATDIIVAGVGKNLNPLGELPVGTVIHGLFNRVSLQVANTVPVIIAYR